MIVEIAQVQVSKSQVGKQSQIAKKAVCLLFLACLSILNSDYAIAETIRGKVKLTGKGADKAKIEDTVIFFEPEQKASVAPLQNIHPIVMKKKAYQPRVSAIPVGSEIQISNYDTILHNAFSPSKPNQFDFGLYGKSEGKTHRFDHAGVVRIFCNVHFHMVAYVLVLDTPYYTRPNSRGEFRLDNLPAGGGRLTLWHERTKRIVKKINLPLNQEQNIELVVSKRRVPEHKNKSGSSYKKKRRSRRKYN